nr:MAG TPA: asparaginyl-tRNA synthetase [Caudoviricetes sp.]DAR89870.1 MAG TPA: asparaginyl-tRNA synthetase [Caudoviricetes sp.]
MQGDYLPVKFGTNVVVAKEDYANVANKNFEYGLESLEGDLQLKDLNTVFFYQGALLKYLFQKGIPEFSTYENYETGAVVQHDGNVWIATKDVKASTHEKVADPCDPCGCKVECENPVYPSKEAGWCKFITSCEYDAKIKELEAKDKALEKAINDLKGVEGFSVVPNAETGALELRLDLSDGSKVTIPMTKFGHIEKNKDGTLTITNANGTTLELPKFVAEHDLDQQKGFYFNTASDKWEVDLRDLVKDGSGLQVDREGYVSIKPTDFIDNNSLEVLPTGKAGVSESWLSKILKPLKDYITNQKGANADAFNKALRNLEAAQKAYAEEKAREAEVMARGNYAEIKAYKENLDKLRQQVGRHENDLGNQANQLKALGLTDEEILALIRAGMNKNNPSYITRIEPVEGGIKVTYANGTTAILGGNSVAVDDKSIVGNGKDKVLSVGLSKRPDNKIRIVDDGVYLGNYLDQTILYVTNSGDDANIGTREKPMRTLKAALDRIPNDYSGVFRIYLKENEHFELGNMTFKNCYLVFSAYGDLVDSKYPEATPYAAYYRGYLAKNYPRPTINIRVRRDDANNRVIRDFVTSTRTIELQGINIHLYNKVDNDAKHLDGYFTGAFNSDVNVIFLGCILEQKSQAVQLTENGGYRNDVFVRTPRINWITSILRNPIVMINSTFNEKVDFINWGYAAGRKNGVQQFEPLVPDNFVDDVTRYWKASSYVTTDAERHLTFGVQFSQDLFNLHPSESWGTAK